MFIVSVTAPQVPFIVAQYFPACVTVICAAVVEGIPILLFQIVAAFPVDKFLVNVPQ